MAAIPQNSIVYYDAGQLKRVAAGSEVELTGAGSMFKAVDLTATGTVTGVTGVFTGNVTIDQNLTVKGDIISKSSYNVMIGDAFIDLLASNTSASPSAGGLTVNVVAASSAFTTAVFTPGVVGVSQPSVTTTATPTGITPNHIIQISGTTDGKNDGLYAVESVSGTTIYIKGVGPTPVSSQTPFLKSDFLSATSTGSLVNATLAGWTVSNGSLNSAPATSIGVGTWCYAYGANDTDFIDAWTPLTAVTVSLQSAYNGGNTINLAGSSNLTVNAPGSGSAAISLNSNAASNFTVAGAALTLSGSQVNLSGGNVNIAKAGGLLADTTAVSAGQVVYFDGTGAAQASDANGSTAAREVTGVATAVGASAFVATVAGTRVFVEFGGVTPSAGDVAYLSTTAGQATNTAPGSAARVTRLGVVTATAASGTLYEIVWNPQYIIDLP